MIRHDTLFIDFEGFRLFSILRHIAIIITLFDADIFAFRTADVFFSFRH
jgi:hypothetical protein